MTKKNRVILDIPKEAMNELKFIMETLDIKSKTEIVRYSLGLMSLIIKQRKKGYDVLLKKGDDVAKVIMPFLGLN